MRTKERDILRFGIVMVEAAWGNDPLELASGIAELADSRFEVL